MKLFIKFTIKFIIEVHNLNLLEFKKLRKYDKYIASKDISWKFEKKSLIRSIDNRF